ncbi:MAG: ATP-binding protein [Myxococcales bacterium]|nr:ATP-binding protein [Myxococcales bacterium]
MTFEEVDDEVARAWTPTPELRASATSRVERDAIVVTVTLTNTASEPRDAIYLTGGAMFQTGRARPRARRTPRVRRGEGFPSCRPAGGARILRSMFDSVGSEGARQGLVGRERELHALHAAFDGGALVVALTGPAGIGKSALAAAFVSSRRCRLIDVDVDAIDLAVAVRDALGRREPTIVVARHLDARPPAPPGTLRAMELGGLDDAATERLAARLGAHDPARVAMRAGGVPLLVEREIEGSPRASTLRLLRLPALHDALAAASLLMTPTERLLGAMLERDAAPLFHALATHAPLQRVDGRLALPDALRDAALAELGERAPELRTVWVRRAQNELLAMIEEAALDARPRLIGELLNVTRGEPYAQLLWDEARDVRFAAPDEGTCSRARDAVRRFEGEASARLFDAWAKATGTELVETHDAAGPRGFVLMASFHPSAAPVDDDPVMDAIRSITASADPPLAPHERVRIARFWLDYRAHQDVRPTPPHWAALIATDAVLSACVHHDTPRWLTRPHRPFAFLGEAEIDGTSYGLFGVDRRREALSAPFARLVEACRHGRTTWSERNFTPLAPLDGATLAEALRDALRSYHRADRLAISPLLGLAWFRDGPSGDTPASHVARRLSELVASLGDEGHDGTLGQVLRATYLSPPRKGLAVAESLGMGYSTYRRWLGLALARLTHALIEREQAMRRRA